MTDPIYLKTSSEVEYVCKKSRSPALFTSSKPESLQLINPLPNNPWFSLPYDERLLKTLWEEEKMLVTSIFPFYHSVFFPI